ncbi:ParB family protein [Pseudomonas fluorescens]|uniref:ParB family protein n=1 Tax=Pseudomonas fluorescens TaxID=294 RepID=UPI001BEC5686|nr:ParB family protein [Pseudomonas fluorescens]MBT2375402.1 ParB family protein [Pseudomonas fluorescens]
MPPTDELNKTLLADAFSRSGPAAVTLSDPLVDTPMVVELDQLRPYELNPRVTRNPLFDELKASIRQRGLDTPPSITRRPGDSHFIIRNGGNTRLAILRELWTETKNERFLRIGCLFRPWPERGEIVALTGHLAENELRGGLTFIERALGVDKARELYEQETHTPLTQAELARRLSLDGYPVQQSHISRMREAVLFLLPAIPTVLYGGLGRHQVERLAVLRKAGERAWEQHLAGQSVSTDYASLFQDVLESFDGETASFSLPRVLDELIGQMSELLNVDYDSLALDIDTTEHRQQALTRAPVQQTSHVPAPLSPLPTKARSEAETSQPSSDQPSRATLPEPSVTPPNDRIQDIHRLVADHIDDPGTFSVADLWHVDASVDSPKNLRALIAQFATEIAAESDLASAVELTDGGIGFTCRADGDTAAGVLQLLNGEHALSALLLTPDRFSDASLIRLFRLLRLARRLSELEAQNISTTPSSSSH